MDDIEMTGDNSDIKPSTFKPARRVSHANA